MINFNVATINSCTEIEGPYKRLAIWFQGCHLHCKGCCNPDYQPLVISHLMSLEDLIKVIQDAKEQYGIEGVTYLGGEPTLQHNLPLLTHAIHELGLGVIAFTGRQYQDVADRLAGCDIVIDGAFEMDHLDNERKLIGSTNQNILCLSPRYQHCLNWFEGKEERHLEVNVGTSIYLNGDYV